MLHIKFIDSRRSETKIKIVLIVLVLALIQCTHGQSNAYKFVSNLYANYQNGNTSFSSINQKSIDTIFSPSFLKLMRMSEERDEEGLGYDLVCDCQDDDGFKIGKIAIHVKNGTTYADVTFSILENEYALTLKIVKENKKWLIDDVITTRGSLYKSLNNAVSAGQ